MSEANFTSHDGMKLFVNKNVPADAKIICVIVHGLCEHQGRYDYLVGKFNAAGIGTYRFDHRGHGRSEGERTYYENFHDMIDDAKMVVDLAKAENPDKPVYLLGHSMGGFCVSLFGAKYPGAVKGIVMSGALTHDNIKLIAGIPAGQDVHGRIPNALGDGVCSVKEVVDWYGKDPYNTDSFSFGLCYQINAGIAWLKERLADWTEPCILLHGEKDALVSVQDSHDFFGAIASKDRQLKVYGGLFHEIFNEYCRDEVIDDAISWILHRA